MEQKTLLSALIWFYRLKQATLFDAQSTYNGFFQHGTAQRMAGDYCPFECQICETQRQLSDGLNAQSRAETPVS